MLEARKVAAQRKDNAVPTSLHHPYQKPPSKRSKEFKEKNGRIKRQKAAMFAKMRTAKHLKVRRPATRSKSASLAGWRAWRMCISLGDQIGYRKRGRYTPM